MYEYDGEVVLIDEDGNEHEFIIVDIFDLDEKQYAVLQPDDGETDEAIILRFGQDEDGNDLLEDIDSDEEWEKAANFWEENFSFEE